MAIHHKTSVFCTAVTIYMVRRIALLLTVQIIPLKEFLIGSKLREKKYCTPSSLVHQPNQCHVVTQRGQSLEIWSILFHFWHHNCCKIPLRLGILLTMLTVVLLHKYFQPFQDYLQAKIGSDTPQTSKNFPANLVLAPT